MQSFLPMRVGHGSDFHRLHTGSCPLILGGVHISDRGGCIAHSDGDLILHALMDALLGALALGDIGQWFPDTDPLYANCESQSLLKIVLNAVQKRGYVIGNVDIICCLQAPKISHFFQEIQKNIGLLCEISPQNVGLKAKTSEGIGSIGRKEAASCTVVACLWSQNFLQSQLHVRNSLSVL